MVYIPAAEELKKIRQPSIDDQLEQRVIPNPHESELRQRNVLAPAPVAATQNFDMNAIQPPQFNNEFVNPAFTQADFMQQYMASWANYMQLLQQTYGAVYMPGVLASPTFPVPTAGIPYYNNWNQAAAAAIPQPQQEQAQQQPPVNAVQPQVNAAEDPAMNAQGGLDEEDFRERDWLDVSAI